MKKLMPATVPDSEREQAVNDTFERWKAGDQAIRSAVAEDNATDALKRIKDIVLNDRPDMFMNDIYTVARYEDGSIIHLSIKRNDRECIHDWRDLQEIKNQLVGEENEGVELYPAESRVVDLANQYHLWVFKDPDFKLNIGFQDGAKSNDPLGKAKQRRRDE